jgi:hypothetical protein
MSRGTGAPVLVLVSDGEARVPAAAPLLGLPPGVRLAEAALRAGFAGVYLAPGAAAAPAEALTVAAGDRVDAPALVACETAAFDPAALRRLARGGGGDGSVFDELGRPVAWWTARLARVPALLPVGPALAGVDAPEPAEVVRLVDADDRPRMEALVLRAVAAELPRAPASARSPWRRWLELPLLRWLAAGRRPLGQLEVLALLLAVLAGVAALGASRAGLVLAGGLLLAGAQLAALVPELARLLGPERAGAAGWLTPAIRPFGHAALAAALTYALVAEAGRSGAADVVLLVLGGAAVVLSLAQARAVLRGRTRVPFELPSAEGFAAQLGVAVPTWLQTPVRVEVLVFVLAWLGPGPPWGVLVGVGLARLWRWFIGQPDARVT